MVDLVYVLRLSPSGGRGQLSEAGRARRDSTYESGAIENVKQSGQLRMTPMARGRGARSKGGAAEREVVELLKAHGWLEARRNFRSGAEAARPTDTPIVAFRRNRSEWLAVLPLEDLLSLLELREIR